MELGTFLRPEELGSWSLSLTISCLYAGCLEAAKEQELTHSPCSQTQSQHAPVQTQHATLSQGQDYLPQLPFQTQGEEPSV